mmetsp:Transcript_121524/g.227124  ORF Transcript_121524/g.227124 Transcript_121524/m.227124 type:complete len:98 (+) Transcript_121524:133-426(+)
MAVINVCDYLDDLCQVFEEMNHSSPTRGDKSSVSSSSSSSSGSASLPFRTLLQAYWIPRQPMQQHRGGQQQQRNTKRRANNKRSVVQCPKVSCLQSV